MRISPVSSSILQLGAGVDLADRAELDPAGAVAGGDGGVLGHPVDLVHRHPDAHEEAQHLGRDRRRPRGGVADLAHPEPVLERAVEEHVADGVPQPRAGGVVAAVGSTSRSPMPSATPSQNAATLRLNHVAPDSRISMPASSFSQIRGTPNRMVGCTSRRFCGTVSMDSAKLTWVPAAALNQVLKIRSATCDSGR